MKIACSLMVLSALTLAGPGMYGSLALDNQAKRPRLVKRVEPVYPPEAVKSGIQGRIAIKAVTDTAGDVVKATLVPVDTRLPMLEKAALDAVRQWKYEPYLVDGQPKPVEFTVMVQFRLNGEEKAVNNPIPVAERPELVKRVAPKYPREALKKHIQGRVLLNVRIDETGRVVKVHPVEGQKVDPLLVRAAAAAVAQWRYQPYLKEGKGVVADFEVTVTFRLN